MKTVLNKDFMKIVREGHLTVAFISGDWTKSGEHLVTITNKGCAARKSTHKTLYGALKAFNHCINLCTNNH